MLSLRRVQLGAVSKALDGHNMFITGAGGVGKTFVLHAIAQALGNHGRRVVVSEGEGGVGRAARQSSKAGSPTHQVHSLGHALPCTERRCLLASPPLQITASTGTAAVNIGGQTFHSVVFGRMPKGSARRRCALYAWHDEQRRTRILEMDVLMVDEVGAAPGAWGESCTCSWAAHAGAFGGCW